MSVVNQENGIIVAVPRELSLLFKDNVGAQRAFNSFLAAISRKVTNSNLTLAEVEQLIINLAHNDLGGIQGGTVGEFYHLTTAEVSKLGGIAAGAEVNVNADWDAVSGDAQILNKPTIPAALSDLTDDTTHRVVTDTEKSAWNAKYGSGDTPTFGDVTITGLGGNIITTDSVETGMEALDDAVTAMNDSGFGAWTSGSDASTYTLSGGSFTIDRAGYGYVSGKKITWASGQSVGSFSANTFYWIYIDSAGVLQKTSTFISNTIRLFELLYDGTVYVVAKENHPIGFDQGASGYLHNNAGTTIRSTGAIITRVATGTGAANGDREVKIVGADTLDDHGLSTTIVDSAGAGVTWSVFYRNGSGKWTLDVSQTQLPIKYNNAGTPTALDVVNVYAEYVLYVVKDDIESSAPQYIAVMGESSFTTLAGVLAAITGGTSIFSTNELKSVEAAQLGYAVVQYSATGGYVEEVIVAKSTFNQQLVGGSAASDHGLLGGLDHDDHLQYHTDARGDARYALLAHNQDANTLTTGTLDGDRLPAFSATKKAGVPATGTPSGKYLKDDGTWATIAGGGDVTGPASAVSGNLATYNGTTGKIIADAGVAPSAFATAAQVHYVGTTSIAANRASATQALTGITSIDGSAATLTTPRTIGGRSFNGSADIVAPTYRNGITTRDVTTASGTVNVAHGLGRVPSVVRVEATLISSASVTQRCRGVYDGTNHSGMSLILAEGTSTATIDTHYTSTAFELGFSAATVVNPYTGANRQTATITVDATNIIFTWTKTGTVAAAVANILWEVN